jgi:hypothetical protein
MMAIYPSSTIHCNFDLAERASDESLLLHVQDLFAATGAAKPYFPPNPGVDSGTLSTSRVEGKGTNTSFANVSPNIDASQKGTCWLLGGLVLARLSLPTPL